MSSVGSRLYRARKQRDLSMAELAQKTHLSKGTISFAESNKTMLSIHNLTKICLALQVSADYVVFGESRERSDEWVQLAATEDGLSLKQVVLNLSKSNLLSRLLISLNDMTNERIELFLSIIELLQKESKTKGVAQ